MKICRNCGTANVSSGQVCFKCNAKLGADEPATSNNTVACGNCSAANAVGAHFCYNCGQAMKPSAYFCNSCGTNNRAEDVYCANCGRKILMDNPPPVPVQAVQPVVQTVQPVVVQQPVYAAPVTETQKYRPVQPPSLPPSPVPPQTKRQYRIQLFFMFALLGGMMYVLTQTFFKGPISGISVFLGLPFKFGGLELAEPLQFLGLENLAGGVALAWIMSLDLSFAVIFVYILVGVITITILVLVIYTISALIRFIFNKPYGHTRKIFFVLFMFNLVLGGISLAALHVEFIGNLFAIEGIPLVFEPDMFFYIYAGGLLLLFIMSRIARVKTPRITKRQQKKAEKKAVKKTAQKNTKKAAPAK